MAKWMLRRLVWMTGVSFANMKKTLENRNVEVDEYDGESIPVGIDDEAEWI
jgi:hypothetical protein